MANPPKRSTLKKMQINFKTKAAERWKGSWKGCGLEKDGQKLHEEVFNLKRHLYNWFALASNRSRLGLLSSAAFVEEEFDFENRKVLRMDRLRKVSLNMRMHHFSLQFEKTHLNISSLKFKCDWSRGMRHERVFFFMVKSRSMGLRWKSSLLIRNSKCSLSSNSVSESYATPRVANEGNPRFSKGRCLCVPTDRLLRMPAVRLIVKLKLIGPESD